MKTPESRDRFQAPSRHYHRHRVEDPGEAWDRWIGGSPGKRRSRKIRTVALWVLAAAAFLTVVGVMCYQMI
jgi:hypothetical protein